MALQASNAKVWLLYLKHTQGARGKLSLNATREICDYIADHLLAQVTPTFLRFFHCSTSTWGPQIRLSRPIKPDNSCTWVMLKDGRLFCSGGSNCQAKWEFLTVAYFLSRYGTVVQLPHMQTARNSHGAIQVSHLYVFGGGKL